ncbi:MAG: glycosyltransferase family 2 protein, partial [Ilumatobacter sp.]
PLTTARQAWSRARSGLCLGAGMAVRREAIEGLGGFDNELGAGARFGSTEDNDLSWRALIAGWKVRHDPAPVVLHDGFRNSTELRALVVRDFFGVGGGISKHVRTRQPGALMFLFSWLWRFGIAEPARQVLSGRRPNGFRRPVELMKGFTAGLRSPFDPATIKFIDPEQPA